MLATNVIELALTSPVPLSYKSGQFIQLRLDGEWRAYSVASMPDDFTLLIIALLIDGGRASKELNACQVGDDLTMLPPNGWFGYVGGNAACFVGTSTGIVPLLAMAREALERGEQKQMTFLFGARTQTSLFCTGELRELERRYANFNIVYALSRPDTAGKVYPNAYTGRVSDYLKEHFSTLKNNVFYVSAWHGTVESLEALLLRLGVERDNLISEYYD